ncbi:MAG: VOC family protein, partial [Planctomycetota bacterium]
QKINRAVWFDIQVSDLDRATAFYAAVPNVGVTKESFDGFEFSVIDHEDGNGGCLVPMPDEVTDKGIMLYLNVEGRIREAAEKVASNDGSVKQDVHPIGPHGFRAVILDSEGNRVVLHSMVDA